MDLSENAGLYFFRKWRSLVVDGSADNGDYSVDINPPLNLVSLGSRLRFSLRVKVDLQVLSEGKGWGGYQDSLLAIMDSVLTLNADKAYQQGLSSSFGDRRDDEAHYLL